MELHEKIDKISSKEDLVEFIEALKFDLKTRPDEWENPTLEQFLRAMGDWIESMDNYYKNTGQLPLKNPSWKTFADILYASKIYE